MNEEILPSTEDRVSNSLQLELYPRGGHVGFVSGGIFTPKYWLEERIVKYFNS